MLIIRGVNVFPSQIEELVLKDGRLAPHYQLEVYREGHLDAVVVHVEPRPDLAGSGKDALDAMARDLQRHIKSLIGISSKVKLREVGAIERSIGKAKRVVDKRPKE
jgi:phenylacetate-CoA ligase